MARNEEKAQSMLFRFRESKASEMGLVARGDKRPRVATLCTDLRQCERWRGELLKDVSRKVSKIQDQGMSDYEVRDLNDEINKLLREKWHWDNQIINLGGANYRRAAPEMINPDGSKVPGMRGYKYFGRAKELPGVKELFEEQAAEASLEASYKKERTTIFDNVGPEYYGYQEEQNEELLKSEREAEEEAWIEQWATLASIIGFPEGTPPPPCPRAEYITLGGSASTEAVETSSTPAATGEKRKASSNDDETASKKTKGAVEGQGAGHRILTALRAVDLQPPKMLSAEEIEAAILQRQKQELLKEYV